MGCCDVVLKIRPLVCAYLEKGGYCLVDLRFYKSQNREFICEVLADRQEGGITLDECADLNRALGEMLEASGDIQESYIMDVSSPGLDRPLVIASDFKRKLGCDIRIFLKEACEGKIEYRGIVERVSDEGIILKTDIKTIVIPFNKVNKAKQVIL